MTFRVIGLDWSRYLGWYQRAETGAAEATLLEVERALLTERPSPDIRALWSHLRAIALRHLGRVDEALDVLDAALGPEGSLSPEATAMLLSRRAVLCADRDHLESLRLYARAESIIRRHQGEIPEHPLWPHILVNFSETAIELGQTERAMTLMRECLSLGRSRYGDWDWFVLRHNLAETLVGEALRRARQAPFTADERCLAEAVTHGREAVRLARVIDLPVKPVYRDIWAAIREAWCGDASVALTVLDPAVDSEGHLTNSLLWLAAASRLRALRRLGDRGRVRGLLLSECELARSMPRVCWDTVAPLLWERSLARLPDMEDDTTELGLLAEAWESRDADRQRYAQVLIEALVDQVTLDAECRRERALALRDTLTGLLNRRGLDPHLRRAVETGEPHALLVIDLDRFKEINDTAGHEAGDRALVAVANLLSRHRGPDDEIARFGGDEFVVLVGGYDQPMRARHLAERLIAEAARANPPLGLSIGIAIRDRATSPGRWLHTADTAMYAAKRAGGAQAVLAGEGVPSPRDPATA